MSDINTDTDININTDTDTDTDTAAPVGIVGLGLVGSALTGRLQRAGFGVLGHDHRSQASAAWATQTGGAKASLQDIGRHCRTVVLAVFDTAGVLQVTEGPQGLLQGLLQSLLQGHPQRVVAGPSVSALIDCSTGDPQALEALAGRLAAQGIDFIEAPLSGSSQQISSGHATMLLGATLQALERHEAVLQALAPQRVHVGGAGMGARAKLATNLVLGLNRAALAEGLVFAERLGISPDAFLRLVLATPARSDAALVKGEQMVRGEFSPQSRMRQHLKDVQLMRAAALAAGQRLPLTDTHATLLQAAVDAGDGELDNAAIIRQLRRETC